jgi:tetratricopeptide (TPR) repeat protein
LDNGGGTSEPLLKVFISYSGNQSKYVASQLRTLLKRTCAAADPWTAPDDLRLGGAWHYALMTRLQSTHFGIICLDRSNLQSPWVHFEAGAIAKTLDVSAVVPYLNGVGAKDLSGPLANFQGVSADRTGTFSLVSALNKILQGKGMPHQTDDNLTALFNAFWPDYEVSLSQAPKVPLDAGTERSDTEVLGELLAIARMHSRLIASLLRNTPAYYPPIQASTLPPEESQNQDMARLQFEQLRRQAMNFRQTGHYDEALEAFGHALALQPEDLETQIDIAVTRTYGDDNQYWDSIQKLSRIVAERGGEQHKETTSASIVAKAFYNLACIKQIARSEMPAQFSFTTAEILSDLEEALKRYPLYVNTASADQDFLTLRKEEGFSDMVERYQKALR